jgi:putative ABC transport system permease protein
MTLFDRMAESVLIAGDTLRTNKLRSGLTILGVVIGVATVMAMAAIVQGIRDQIVHTLEVAGPTTFYVLKYFSDTPVNPDALPKSVRIRPDLTVEEANIIAQLPEIRYATLWARTFARIEFGGTRTQNLLVWGADEGFTYIEGGALSRGRWFTRSEILAGDAVAVLQENIAARIFGHIDPLDQTVRIGGRPARVIGIWQQPGNIFAPPGGETGAIVPYFMLDHQFKIDRVHDAFIPVKPRPHVTVADAQTSVIVALRESRHLRPGDPNTFDLITQGQILSSFNKITGAFFWVMIALAGVALLVGGIGVMAMMMVSVTDRTREIGVRKALGATRLDILLQFLVEAATLTGLGGVVGLLIGLGMGDLLSAVMGTEASPPFGLTVIAVTVSVSIGIIFGLVPALRAARLDPIASLRYE